MDSFITQFKCVQGNEEYIANEINVTSVVFSKDGKYFGATNNSWMPTIYAIDTPAPLLLLRSDQNSSAFEEYKNGVDNIDYSGYLSHSTYIFLIFRITLE